MPAPFRNADPTVTADDLASQVHVLNVAAHRLKEAVCKLALEGATSKDFDEPNAGRAIESLRATFEGTVEDVRTMFAEALRTPGAANGSIASLVFALRERLAENDIAAGLRPASPLLTAMRRVDAAEAGLVSAAQDRGAAVLAFDRQATADYQLGFRSSAEA